MVKEKIVLATGKRKKAVAHARVNAGKGRIRINSTPLSMWGSEVMRLWVKEPIIMAGERVREIDIDVNVRSGGTTGQAEAVRMAIAKGIVEFTKDRKLKEMYIKYDRNLLVYDPRRTEPHKPSASKRGPRRHKQRSKR